MSETEIKITFPRLIIYIIDTIIGLAFIGAIFYYAPVIEVGIKHGFCYASNLATETNNRSQMNNILHLLESDKITDSIFSPGDAVITKRIKKRCDK